jgi:lipoprotein NlpI
MFSHGGKIQCGFLICEANFYTGELALLKGTKDEAVRLFRLTANGYPHDFVEWDCANAALKALGVAQ